MKEYPITFTTDYSNYKSSIFTPTEEEIAPCKKYSGKTITLDKLSEFVEEVGTIIFNGETVEVYNDYRE